MTRSRRKNQSLATLQDAELMAVVLEGRHGAFAAEVAEFFALLHTQLGDESRRDDRRRNRTARPENLSHGNYPPGHNRFVITFVSGSDVSKPVRSTEAKSSWTRALPQPCPVGASAALSGLGRRCSRVLPSQAGITPQNVRVTATRSGQNFEPCALAISHRSGDPIDSRGGVLPNPRRSGA